MGKSLGTVEYAYLMSFTTSLNRLDPAHRRDPIPPYLHEISIQYELLDANQELLKIDTVVHGWTTEVILDTTALMSELSTSLYEYVRADKIKFSGFDIGPIEIGIEIK